MSKKSSFCQTKKQRHKDSWKFKVDSKLFRGGVGHFGHRTLKLAVSLEGMDGMNWFCACC